MIDYALSLGQYLEKSSVGGYSSDCIKSMAKFFASQKFVSYGTMLTLSTPRGTDGSFQPTPSMTIVLFIVTILPCQVGLWSSIESCGQK